MGIKDNTLEQARYRAVFRLAGIPIGEITKVTKSGPQADIKRYYFIATQHLTKAVQALVIS